MRAGVNGKCGQMTGMGIKGIKKERMAEDCCGRCWMREIGIRHVCVNGATRAAGGSGWSAYKRCRVVMHFSFLRERNGLGAVMVSGERTGGKREEKGKKREDGRGKIE